MALSLKKGPSPRRDLQALQDLSLEVFPLRWFPPLESFEQLTSVSGQVSLHTEDTLSSGCAQWPCLPGLLLPTLPFKLLLKRLSPHSKPPLVLPPLSALHPASYSSPVLPPTWHSLQSWNFLIQLLNTKSLLQRVTVLLTSYCHCPKQCLDLGGAKNACALSRQLVWSCLSVLGTALDGLYVHLF